MPARSPRPADPPESPELAEALLVGAATVTPPEAESPQWPDDVQPSRQSQVDYHENAQPPQLLPSVLV